MSASPMKMMMEGRLSFNQQPGEEGRLRGAR